MDGLCEVGVSMTQRERAIAERDQCRQGDTGDWGALMGELDWEAELTFIAEDEATP